MIRGSTPTHIFRLPISTGTLTQIRITYEQFSKTVLEKTEKDVILDENEIRVKLTQEDTLLFRSNVSVQLQLKVLTVDGIVLASPVKDLPVERILNEEVL